MKLDLLYEVDAPKPWGKPHPWGPRERKRRAYYDAIEQIKLAILGKEVLPEIEKYRPAPPKSAAPATERLAKSVD